MKVIFLDIDGVLNVASKNRDEFGQIFTERFVNNLSFIIACTKAKIVISSTWRYRGDQFLIDLWKNRGLPGEIIGRTIGYFNPEYYELFGEKEVVRGEEIKHWLENNSNIESYVILDDDSDMLPEQKYNFVQTSNNINHNDCADIGYGLTKICAEKAIRILNK